MNRPLDEVKNRMRIKNSARAGAFMLALALAWLTWGFHAGEAQETQATNQPEPGNVVRVLLTRLRLTNRLDIALDGSYSLEPYGIAFQRGSKLTLSTAQEGLILYYEGMAMHLPQLTLKRHAVADAEAENGLRLNGNANLFAGDLAVSSVEGGLQAILHIPMEEYLLGVVPYEMSDSFPVEALKAQAIAARTYAQRKVGSAQAYDVVDNTNDQVFKGYNKRNAQAAQAIRETANLCAFVDGTYARCFYTASNGGQTELMQNVWPDGGKELFVVQDDPYDVQNPLSEVRAATLPRALPEKKMGAPGMDDLVKAALAEPLEAMGYDGEAANIRLDAIEAVSVHTPQYGEPSRLMTQLRLTLRVQARKAIVEVTPEPTKTSRPTATPKATPTQAADDASPAPTAVATQAPTVIPMPQWTAIQPVPEPITIDLPIFPKVEAALGLSINGGSNELMTVIETEEAFVLEARRFGHGVGMSQRGAQWMAATEGWNYAKILHFYYPGITLQKVGEAPELLPPIEAAFLRTPGPAATPTPRPTLMPATVTPQAGQWRGKVANIAADSWLNLRNAPTSQGDVLHQLYLGQPLLVMEELPDGWVRVQTDAVEGYVMVDFVQREAEG